MKITPNRLGLSWEHQKTPLSLKKAGGGVQWGCCSEHPNQTSLILILILILNLAFVPYHIPLFPAAGAPNLIGPIKTRESVLTCNSHPSSSFLSPKKTKIGSGISRLCQETYQLLCHDVVVTEGLEQGHEANLTASSEVEGEEMVHQEAAVRPGVPQQREFALEKKKQKN